MVSMNLDSILPGMFLGYHHPSGEKHIMDNNAWVACPGQDNESDECTTGDVPTIFNGDESDHDGMSPNNVEALILIVNNNRSLQRC